MESKRENMKQAFKEFMQRDNVNDWTIKDDVILHEMIVTGIEIFTGHDGEQIFKDIMMQAHALARYKKLGAYLE